MSPMTCFWALSVGSSNGCEKNASATEGDQGKNGVQLQDFDTNCGLVPAIGLEVDAPPGAIGDFSKVLGGKITFRMLMGVGTSSKHEAAGAGAGGTASSTRQFGCEP